MLTFLKLRRSLLKRRRSLYKLRRSFNKLRRRFKNKGYFFGLYQHVFKGFIKDLAMFTFHTLIIYTLYIHLHTHKLIVLTNVYIKRVKQHTICINNIKNKRVGEEPPNYF